MPTLQLHRQEIRAQILSHHVHPVPDRTDLPSTLSAQSPSNPAISMWQMSAKPFAQFSTTHTIRTLRVLEPAARRFIDAHCRLTRPGVPLQNRWAMACVNGKVPACRLAGDHFARMLGKLFGATLDRISLPCRHLNTLTLT